MEDGLVQILWKVSKLSKMVLILIVVEDGLVLFLLFLLIFLYVVLILIVVEDGLVPISRSRITATVACLNPYCSGRWSRTNAQDFTIPANMS